MGLDDPRDDPGAAEPTVVLRSESGAVLAAVPLGVGTPAGRPAGGRASHGRRFAVSYRNSIYGTLSESRYVVRPRGRFRLVQVAADQRAVIEEYYALPGRTRPAPAGDRRTWVAEPRRRTVFGELAIAATDLGERVLHVPGHRQLRLWRLVPDRRPVVVLDVENR